MEGLYRGKYLIVLYGKDGLPFFVSEDSREFVDTYMKYTGIKDPKSVYKTLYRIANGLNKSSRISLIEADTITHDCFEEEDKEFVKFIKDDVIDIRNNKKTPKNFAKKLGISIQTYYRWIQIGKIKKPVYED